MICKFLFYVIYLVDSPTLASYSTGVYVLAENEEHASLCAQDYFCRHSLTARIVYVQYLPHFLFATADQYPQSKLLNNHDRISNEVD